MDKKMKPNWNQILVDLIKKFTADVGMIHRLNQQSQELELLVYSKEFPEELLEKTRIIPVQKGTIAAVTVLQKKPITISNLSTDPAKVIKPMERKLGIAGMTCVPIFDQKDNVVGTLGIGCFRERTFSEKETNALIAEGKALAKLM